MDLTTQPALPNVASFSANNPGDIYYSYLPYPGGWYPAPYVSPPVTYLTVADWSLSTRMGDLERENAALRGKVETLEKMVAALIGKRSE